MDPENLDLASLIDPERQRPEDREEENHFGVGLQLPDCDAPDAVAGAGIGAACTLLWYVVSALPVLLAAGRRSYAGLPVLWAKGKSRQAHICLKDVESVFDTALQRAKGRAPFSGTLANVKGRWPSSFRTKISRAKWEITPARFFSSSNMGFTAPLPPRKIAILGGCQTIGPHGRDTTTGVPLKKDGTSDRRHSSDGRHVHYLSQTTASVSDNQTQICLSRPTVMTYVSSNPIAKITDQPVRITKKGTPDKRFDILSLEEAFLWCVKRLAYRVPIAERTGLPVRWTKKDKPDQRFKQMSLEQGAQIWTQFLAAPEGAPEFARILAVLEPQLQRWTCPGPSI